MRSGASALLTAIVLYMKGSYEIETSELIVKHFVEKVFKIILKY